MTPIIISILGAASAMIVSFIGAWLANRNSIILQTRKLKEEHYVAYIEAMHHLTSQNDNKTYGKNYTFTRDKLFLIGSEDVSKKMLAYETEAVGKESHVHDKY